MASITSGDKVRAPLINIAHDRYLSNDTTTTVATGASEKVLSWNLIQASSPNIIAAGFPGNTMFTLLKSGIWFIEFCTRISFNVAPSSGDMFAWAYRKSDGAQLCGTTVASPINNAPVPAAWTVRPFNAGDQIECRVRNSTNQVFHMNCIPDFSHISLTWLQPA